jgi:hypothetical protein
MHRKYDLAPTVARHLSKGLEQPSKIYGIVHILTAVGGDKDVVLGSEPHSLRYIGSFNARQEMAHHLECGIAGDEYLGRMDVFADEILSMISVERRAAAEPPGLPAPYILG